MLYFCVVLAYLRHARCQNCTVYLTSTWSASPVQDRYADREISRQIVHAHLAQFEEPMIAFADRILSDLDVLYNQYILIDQVIVMHFASCALGLLLLVSLSEGIVDRTYYIYMGLPISTSQPEIERAYLQKKAKVEGIEDEDVKSHKMKLLQQAYATLGDPQKRELYDKFGKESIKKTQFISMTQRVTEKSHRKDRTIEIHLPVSVDDIYHGKTVQALFLKKTVCNKCHGTGAESPKFVQNCAQCAGHGFTVAEGANMYGQKMVYERTCQACGGSGKKVTKACSSCGGKKIVEKLEQVRIQIPRGLPDGNILAVKNFGDEKLLGAPSDLSVVLQEIPSEHWARKGSDLIHTMQISFQEALFGFEKYVTHLSGEQILISREKIVTKDSKIVIEGQGIEIPQGRSKGKLIVKFKIVMQNFTDRQLDMWEEFFKKYPS